MHRLQNELNEQDNCFTKTPLYCVYDDRSPEEYSIPSENGDNETAQGWPIAIFLTDASAEAYVNSVSYRLKNPRIYVRGPGEDSDIHGLISWVRSISNFEAIKTNEQ